MCFQPMSAQSNAMSFWHDSTPQSSDGQLLSGAAAFAQLWRSLPLLRPLGELARIPFVLRVLESLYLKFLVIRPKLQAMLSIKERRG